MSVRYSMLAVAAGVVYLMRQGLTMEEVLVLL